MAEVLIDPLLRASEAAPEPQSAAWLSNVCTKAPQRQRSAEIHPVQIAIQSNLQLIYLLIYYILEPFSG